MLKKISKIRWIMMAVAAVFLALLSMLDFSGQGMRYLTVILRSAFIFVGCAFLQEFNYTRRDIIISGACGLIFAIFLWVGIFTEYNLFYMVHGWEGVLRILIYLGVRCIVIGGFILLLFKVLEKTGGKAVKKVNGH